MQHSKFTLADKKQYITNLVAQHYIALIDLVGRLDGMLKELGSSAEDPRLAEAFAPCYRDFNGLARAIEVVFEATDAKQAIAAVKQFKTGSRGSKLN